jgi:transposase
MSYSKWLGVDVSKDKLDISIFDGEVHIMYQIANDKKAITKFLKDKVSLSDTHVIMEVTGTYHMVLFTKLIELGYSASVVNPLIINRYSQMKLSRAKTDRVDARIIAEFGYNQKPELSKLPPANQVKIANKLKAIDSFLNIITMLSNKIHALKSSGSGDNCVIKEYNHQILSTRRSIKRLEEQIENLIRENYQELYDLLIKIPGVGPRTSSMIISFFGKYDNFESADQVISFVGLNPNPRKSGTSVNRSSNISKKGNPYFRKILYEASLTAMKYNPVCADLYERLLNKGVHKTKCRVAVAHKLLRQTFGVLKNGREWEPYYHKHRIIEVSCSL